MVNLTTITGLESLHDLKKIDFMKLPLQTLDLTECASLEEIRLWNMGNLTTITHGKSLPQASQDYLKKYCEKTKIRLTNVDVQEELKKGGEQQQMQMNPQQMQMMQH